MSWIGEEIRNTLKPLLDQGAISLLESHPVEQQMNDVFPFGVGRLQWSEVPDNKWRTALAEPANRRATVTRFLQESLAHYELTWSGSVIWIGDDVTEFVIRLNLAQLCANADVLFGFPQHCYVVPETCDWCFNYTFEDDMFFGVRP